MTTTHVRIIRCHCRTCGADYTRWRLAGDVRAEPDPTAPCAACVGADFDYAVM